MTEGQTRVIVMILVLLGLEILANPDLKAKFSSLYKTYSAPGTPGSPPDTQKTRG